MEDEAEEFSGDGGVELVSGSNGVLHQQLHIWAGRGVEAGGEL